MRITSKPNQRGSIAIAGVAFVIFIIGYGALSTVQFVASESGSSANEYEVSRSMYVGQAGLEYAKKKIYDGDNPEVTNKSFSDGTITITTVPASRQVTVASTFSGSTKTQVINTNFAKDCMSFNTATADNWDVELQNFKIVKSCAASGINTTKIAKMTITWNWHACVTGDTYNPPTNDLSGCPVDTQAATIKEISIENTKIYDAAGGIGSPGGGGATSGQEIDVVDYGMTTNQTYTFDGNPKDIRFSSSVPTKGLYTILVEFVDRSQKTVTFQDP